MSVRKVYSVLIDGESVFSGSYKSCLFVYSAFETFFCEFNLSDYNLCLAFQPSAGFKNKKSEGGVLDV